MILNRSLTVYLIGTLFIAIKIVGVTDWSWWTILIPYELFIIMIFIDIIEANK